MTNDGRTMRRRLILLGICAAFGLAVWLLGPPEGLAGFALEAHVKAHVKVGEEAGEEAYEKAHEEAHDEVRKEAEPSGVLAGKAWTVLAVFVGVILSLMLRPFPMGPMVLVGVVLITALHAAGKNDAIGGYGKAVTWLVVAAFIIAAGLVRSGLGTRIALWLVVKLGRTTLGLAYALSAADLLLAPVVPSNTARGGGILAPIFRSLAGALGSEPDADPRRAGSYLAFVGAMATVTTSAMLRAGREPAPAKMTSSISLPRICLADVSPITHLSASTRFDLPQPLGPTMPVMPGSMASSVGSTKDLKPESRSLSNCTIYPTLD